jgi:hypothetical protein
VRGFAETIGRLAHGPTRSTFASAISISLAAVGAGRAFCHTPLPAAAPTGTPDLRRMAAGDRPSPRLRPLPDAAPAARTMRQTRSSKMRLA